MGTIILLVVVAAIAIWVIGAYNGLISLKNQVINAWKQIDVQLKRRHDLIPNLVNTVKGYMQFEQTTLEAVISARNKAVAAQGVPATARAEGELSQALGRLFALSENYPELKSSENFKMLQDQLEGTENRIATARTDYNGAVEKFNATVRRFPSNLTAKLFGLGKPRPYFELTTPGAAEVPKVDFGKP